ncbi:magnesium-dependent deoxyribonuclease, TatD family, and radical SAM domain iron-sulfur oxidoreductase [Citrifermentans bemidjiense Bem]|uniref:Magnesium-dependent deoxyribonuclease, TatD family, and radical SAM domain iron-sulfur oxidoreductase n=1 Tax=Citrifermentans bemidjiense (strain ATCC BAA-1014 / DSM 16622 / JCM 12645 / Bem) TaxID=404380 RepID=B5ECM8_CITBB|nr:TatD family hydrolase [Citrifermentans bemidjiense]ACH39063.1 magnesium-dependent deoxyribonuclease, TatD family, and radical SAM domain iron-sulfur oxidoreductase [Citrifermentans bemidjiense Bem]
MELIDSHAHIYGKEYAADFEEMMERAAEAGVGTIVAVGADLESSQEALALAGARENVYCSVGIHPHDADRVTERCYELVREMALSSPKVVAIGEIGLDFFRDRSSRENQEEVFRRFIRMGRELSLPLIIHDRDAHDRIMAILREEKAGEVGGVLHCFSGDLAMAQECIELGFKISIPGTVTYPSNEALREVVRGVKIEQLMVETDAPYLTPVPHRGKRNEPAFVRLTAERVAQVKGLSPEDVGRITSFNTRKLFGIPQPAEQDTIAYMIRNSLYLNITNRCSNRCTFCPKFDDFAVKGHELKLSHEPNFAEVMAAVDRASGFEEVVFCGYGEPLVRLDLVKEVAAELKRRGIKVRINTDGQANLVHGRNILPELAGLVDVLSVSLNAANAEDYQRLCNTPFGAAGFQGVCDFLREAPKHVPQVTASAVTVPGLDVGKVRELALSLGVDYREREYAEVG